jgi:hypothetical protein
MLTFFLIIVEICKHTYSLTLRVPKGQDEKTTIFNISKLEDTALLSPSDNPNQKGDGLILLAYSVFIR